MILLDHQQAVPKMLCDSSLEDTAHWLRAAGYDVYIPINKLSDQQLLDLALEHSRVLLINHTDIQGISTNLESVIPLESSFVYDQIKQVAQSLSIDWLYRPLSRCMICNTELLKLNINQWIDLPVAVQQNSVTSHGCPSCQRIYWAGDQLNRMVGQLQLFKNSNW